MEFPTHRPPASLMQIGHVAVESVCRESGLITRCRESGLITRMTIFGNGVIYNFVSYALINCMLRFIVVEQGSLTSEVAVIHFTEKKN